MQADPVREEIEVELRALRTQPTPLGLEHVALSPALTDLVGRGSTERAYGIVMDTLDRYGADPTSDVRAFFETCGLGLSGTTLNQRLDEYAAKHFVDRRTGLRRSDRGASKLSYILRDELNYERPEGKVVVSEVNGLVTLGVIIEIPSLSQWRRPVVWINGTLISREFELHDSGRNDLFVIGKERYDSTPLEPSDGDELFTAQVLWSMSVWPIWTVSTHLKTPGLGSVFDLERQSGVRVSLWK